MKEKRTLIIGATTNPNRYAYMAANRLLDHNYPIDLLGIKKGVIRNVTIKPKEDIEGTFDTVTLYVGPARQSEYIDFVVALKPKRVIFNPGTWNDEFVNKLESNKIEAVDACTLVMLSAGTY